MTSVKYNGGELRKRNEARTRTRVQCWGNGIEHISIHVCMYGPVGGGVVAGSHKYGVSLCNSDTKQVGWGLLDISLT